MHEASVSLKNNTNTAAYSRVTNALKPRCSLSLGDAQTAHGLSVCKKVCMSVHRVTMLLIENVSEYK